VKGKQDAANGFSRASAKFCESRRISLQIQDELDKQAHRRNTVKAESPSSMLANASKDEKELQLDVLLSIDHNLDRIAKALEELVSPHEAGIDLQTHELTSCNRLRAFLCLQSRPDVSHFA
jgi:hypothetical protein